MLKNRVNGCHGNHAFFHSAIEFIFEDKNSLHFWGPNERFGTHEKLSWGGGCKVGQISSRGKKIFEIVDDGRSPEHGHPISSPLSLRLR